MSQYIDNKHLYTVMSQYCKPGNSVPQDKDDAQMDVTTQEQK